MRYRAIVPGVAVMTIAPEQYHRLREVGFMVRGNGSVKTVYLNYEQYEHEQPQARAYTHEQHHKKHTTCHYQGCEKAVA